MIFESQVSTFVHAVGAVPAVSGLLTALLASLCPAKATAPSPNVAGCDGALCEYVRISEILIKIPQPSGSHEAAESRHKVEEVRETIRSGIPFEDVAKANSQGPSAAMGGDLGYFGRGELAPSLEKIGFGLQVGDLSEVIRTTQGFVILQVTDRKWQKSRPVEVLNASPTSDFEAYVKSLRRRILRNWYGLVPSSVQTKGGTVTLKIVVQRNGDLLPPEILSTSGDAELDMAAVAAVREVRSFSPIPKTSKADPLVLRLNFIYNPAEAIPPT